VARVDDRVWLLLKSAGSRVPQLHLREFGHRVDFLVDERDDGAVLSVAAPRVQQAGAAAAELAHSPLRPPTPANDCGEQERKRRAKPKCQ
jgi:hypothetical protein